MDAAAATNSDKTLIPAETQRFWEQLVLTLTEWCFEEYNLDRSVGVLMSTKGLFGGGVRGAI